jgi:hypothetical protein
VAATNDDDVELGFEGQIRHGGVHAGKLAAARPLDELL